MSPGTKRIASIDTTQQNVTGINHWWSYEQGSIPGVGSWMVNAYSGNLIVQADDMDVPHRGIDLAFRRTYNSFSRHDFAGYDGANEVGQYGNGWTNTWDAHLSTNGCPNTGYSWAGFYGFSVHDVDGARYDYCFNSTGQLIPPTGMQGTSLVVNPDGGSFYWTKKTGTQYTFYAPYYSGTSAAYSGRIYRISGRNQKNYIQFSYAWSPDASSSGNLTNIYAATDNGGSQATLTFQDFSGQQLLWQLTRPDGATITYDYDTAGELISVSKPAPNNSGTPAVETYNGYQSFLMVAGPRWNAGGENDGGYVAFYMDETTTAQVDGIEWVGIVNFQPSDGGSTVLQPSVATGPIIYAWEDVRVTPTYTSFSDTDGHSVVQYLDAAGRPTAREEYTGSQWLQTTEGWDAGNDLVSSTDQRGYETDYLYDPMGNTTAVAEPYTTTSQGSFRPTKLYDYDEYNNVVAYCDEKASHANGGRGDWTSAGPPTSGAPDALCASNGSSAHATFTYPGPAPAYEPFGQLTSIHSPLGYTRTIGYDPSKQGGVDYGLPTSVRGSAIAQTDGTRTAYQTITYDSAGNILCASTDGNDPTTTTLLIYDSLSRVVARGDPDDASVTNGCAKTAGIAGSAIATRTTYFPNGQVATTTTPAEAAANVSTQFQYDLDGDVTSEQHHFVAGAGPIQKWYDGADRLVEVRQPTDANDFYTFPWTTRYLYDLTQGGTVAIGSSAPYRAYGGLYKTQELLPSGVTTPQWNEAGSIYGASTGTSNPTWQDTAGTAFDALDRPVTAYRNTGNGLMPVTSTYDGAGSAGLLSQKCNANNECASYSYDPRGAKSQATFNVSSASTQSYSYDEDGNVATASNGVGSFSDAYDADGRKTSRQETVGATSATIRYAYYDDGLRKSLDAITGSQNLPGVLTYTYRPDGMIRQLRVASAYTFSFGYTGGRRLMSRADNTGQAADNFTYTGSGSPTSYGLVQSMTTPGFYETGMTYNAEWS